MTQRQNFKRFVRVNGGRIFVNEQTGGALSFVVAILGWYVTIVMICAELRITVKLPVGDLSHLWPDSDKTMAEMEREGKDQ